MSTLINYRLTVRSPKAGIGIKDLSGSKGTWVNVEDTRVLRDLARHSAISQYFEAQPARYQGDTAQVSLGGVVTPRAGSLTVDIAPSQLKYVAGTDAVYTKDASVAVGALTQAITPHATLPQITAIGYNTSTPGTPTAAVLNGTAAATVLENRAINAYAGLPGNPNIETTADRTWLALVWVPPSFTTGTSVAATGVFTVNGHGYKVGDPIWLSGLTGGSALSANTIYYVNSVPSANTFTVSTTLGGPTLLHGSNVTVSTIQRQILASDVIDTRP